MMLVFFKSLLELRKKKPMTGISPKIGTLVTVSLARSLIRPPITTVCWSRATTVVLVDRLDVAGPRLL